MSQTIFIVMHRVDLGGHPVKAFFDSDKAYAEVDKLNGFTKAEKIAEFVAKEYSQKDAEEQWLWLHRDYYMQVVEIE